MNIEFFQSERKSLLHLFLLADDSGQQIQGYLYQGDVLVAHEVGEMFGQVQLISIENAGAFVELTKHQTGNDPASMASVSKTGIQASAIIFA